MITHHCELLFSFSERTEEAWVEAADVDVELATFLVLIIG